MQKSWVGKIPLEKEMATHSSTLAWQVPWTEEPGGLQSMGSQSVRHDLATKQQQCITMSVYKAQGLLEVEPSSVLDLDDSNQFMSYPLLECHSFKGCAPSLPLVSRSFDIWLSNCCKTFSLVSLLL